METKLASQPEITGVSKHLSSTLKSRLSLSFFPSSFPISLCLSLSFTHTEGSQLPCCELESLHREPHMVRN